MSLSIGEYSKSLYEKELEASINTNLSSISANQTTYATAIATLSGNITTISASITTISAHITSKNEYSDVTVSSAIYTVSLTTYRNFKITNSTATAATLKISGVPTASGTYLNLNVMIVFSATATFTYTGTITWSQNSAPNPTAVGTFMINMKSFNNGTNWYASFTGLY